MVNAENLSLTKLIEVQKHNSKLSNAFIGVAGLGFAIAFPAEATRFIVHPSINEMVNFNGLMDTTILKSDSFKYFSNHIKGMGQAIYYTQAFNLAVMQVKSDKGFKNKDLDAAPYKDASFATSALVLAGAYVWEKITERNGQFDTTDMAWYAVGMAVLIGCNKLIGKIISSPNITDTAVQPVAKVISPSFVR